MPLSDIVHFASNRAFGNFVTTFGNAANTGIELIRTDLVACTWSLDLEIHASSSLSAPFGFPTTGSGRMGVWCYVATKAYWIYDPTVPGEFEAIPVTIGPYLVIPVAATATSNGTRDVLAASIVDMAGVGGTPGANDITLTAPGVPGNDIFVSPNGAFMTSAGNSYGGGYVLTSKSQKDNDPTSANNARITLKAILGAPGSWNVTHRSGYPGNDLQLEITIGGSTTVYHLQQGTFFLIANEYQVYIYSNDPFHAGDVYVGDAELFAGTPFVPQSLTGITAAAFMLRKQNPTLGKTQPGATTTILVNADYKDDAGFGLRGWTLNMWRYPGNVGPLLTRMGKELEQPALLSMSTSAAGGAWPACETRFIGYIWDAFVTSRYNAPPSQTFLESFTWRAMLAQKTTGDTEGTMFLLTLG